MENTLLALSPEDRKKLAEDVKKRQASSLSYYAAKRLAWQRQYKKYRAMQDEIAENDEPDLKIAIAFGIVEDLVARLVDNVLGRLTVMVKPKRPDHTDKASKFYNACRSFFGAPDFRIDYINSSRERVIIGSSWEFDEWLSQFAKGTRWKTNKVMKQIKTSVPTLAKAIEFVTQKAVSVMEAIPHDYPVHVGPHTRFPSAFRVHPAPGIKKDTELPWVIEEVPFISLDELRSAQYPDPKDPQKLVSVYDLAEFDAMKKAKPDALIKPIVSEDEAHNSFEEVYTGVSVGSEGIDYGVDGVYLQIMREPDKITVVANGTIVISQISKPFQKPGIKCRLRVYTQDPQCLFGIGAIEPIFDLLDEIDDVHNMTMADWVRSVNDMLIYDEEAIPYPSDFESRAGGKIRVKAGTVLPNAVMGVPRGPSNANTMVLMESNLKGLAERITSVGDMSPGAMGTKPSHTTYGGLMEVVSSLAKRFRINAILDQAQSMRQMDTLYWFFDQFMFSPLPFTDYSKGDGTAVEYVRDDFDTDGLGFCYIATDDPSYGDPSVLRNQNMALLTCTLDYEQRRRTLGADWDEARPDEVMRSVIEAFGKTDTAKYIKAPNGVLSPENEWSMMLQGLPVDPNPKENLAEHYIKHLWDLRKAESDPNMDPRLLVMAQDHTRKTQALLAAMLAHPESFVDDAGKEQVLAASRPQLPAAVPGGTLAGSSLPAMGQNAASLGAGPAPARPPGGGAAGGTV